MKRESEVASGSAGSPTAPESTTKEVYVFPVTAVQERLLLQQQLDPTSTSYNVTWSIRMTGQLNVDALKRGLNEIVCRHEILRTTFKWTGGQPAQIVSPEVRIALSLVDLAGLTQAEQEAQVAAMKEAQEPIDLSNGPVFRTRLLRLGATNHVLLFTSHQVIFDPWSCRIFVTELATLCEAFSSGRQLSLQQLPLQYADYAVWQQNYLQGEKLGKLLSFCKEQLAGSPELLDLPLDRLRSTVQSFKGASRSFVVPQALYEEVIRSSRMAGVTTFMTLLASFQVLLSRYSGQDDIVVGTPVANRNRVEIEGLIGHFANMLPLRIKLDGDPTFCEFVERVKETSLGAYENQDIPLERLMEELRPKSNLGIIPLFQVLFSLQNASPKAFELRALQFEPLSDVTHTSAKFDISVVMLEGEGSLCGRVDYNTDLFNASTMDRMMRHYLGLLEAALDDPSMHISQLPLRLSLHHKVNRRAGSAAGLVSRGRSKTIPPRNELEAAVLKVWQDVLGVRSIGITDNFFDIGGHSLLAIRLIGEIQNATGKRLPVSTLFEGPTVEYLARTLEQSPNEVIVEIQRGNAKPPFFGIVAPGARGFYVALAQHLGANQPFYRIQGTGAQPEGRSFNPTEYENLAAEYIEAIKTVQPRGPYYFGGMCQGAHIAFDMARRLEARGEKVGLLAIFDTWVIENSRNRSLFLIYHYSMCLLEFWRRTNREKWQTLTKAVKHPFRPRGPSSFLKAALWPGRDFVPAKCAVKITLFKTPSQQFYYINNPLLGWETRTKGGVDVQLVHARHRHLLREPDVRQLAEKLAHCLSRPNSRAEDHGCTRASEVVGQAACHTR